jgi:FKBP-type peptidyl-prolyl cis-trans isomerase
MKKFILSVMAVAALACGLSSCKSGAPKATYAQGDLDTLAYAYGVMFGNNYSNFQDTGVVVPEKVMNLDNFISGFVTAIRRDSAKLDMSVEEAQQFLQNYQMKMREEMEAKRQAELKENKTKGADFMAENAKKAGVVVTESGLQIETIKEGTGKQAKDGDKVLVNYKGTLIDGTQFDANDSTEFNVNGVVKGFKEGILSMKEGGKVKLTMPSELAYGDRGAGQNIPGGSTLVFDVELLKVIPAPAKKK